MMYVSYTLPGSRAGEYVYIFLKIWPWR